VDSAFGNIEADEAKDKTMVACKQVKASSYAVDTSGEAATLHASSYSTIAASSIIKTATQLNPHSIAVVVDHHPVRSSHLLFVGLHRSTLSALAR